MDRIINIRDGHIINNGFLTRRWVKKAATIKRVIPIPPTKANDCWVMPTNRRMEKVSFRIPTQSLNQSGYLKCLNSEMIFSYRTTHTKKMEAHTRACRKTAKLCMMGNLCMDGHLAIKIKYEYTTNSVMADWQWSNTGYKHQGGNGYQAQEWPQDWPSKGSKHGFMLRKKDEDFDNMLIRVTYR